MAKERTTTQLFAHIENDAHLSGTYDLQGLSFSPAIQNLQRYLQYRISVNQPFPKSYLTLLEDMEYLLAIETKLRNIKEGDIPLQIKDLATEIARNFFSMGLDMRRLLPGGWRDNNGSGHAMIYQIIRKVDGYHFSLINSGDGLEFHHKKSALHKELYNPTMTWHFPLPTTESEKLEVGLFIERLLGEMVFGISNFKKLNPSGHRLYQIIMPSISHINGTLIDSPMPDFADTGGQLSGTCVERCLHQALKINSSSEQVYVNFIYDFKHYTLKDYVNPYLTGSESLSAGIKQQINLAIQNNLKIINNPTLFSSAEIEGYSKELSEFEEKINTTSITLEEQKLEKTTELSKLTIEPNAPISTIPDFTAANFDKNFIPLLPLQPNNFLTNLKENVEKISTLNSPSFIYYSLQQLVLDLPMNLNNLLYAEFKTQPQWEEFANYINNIQDSLIKLQNSFLKQAQDPALNVMILKITVIEMKLYALKAQYNNLPDFTPFAKAEIQLVIGNTLRNPFWATNHPALDATLKELQNDECHYPTDQDYWNYYKELLASNPKLNAKLEDLFDKEFGSYLKPLPLKIKDKDLKSPFMISLYLLQSLDLGSEYQPLIKLVRAHLNYERKLNAKLNLFKLHPYYITVIQFELVNNKLSFSTPLRARFSKYTTLSEKLTKPSYTIENSSALKALAMDTSTSNVYQNLGRLVPKTANKIQLQSIDNTDKKSRAVTEADIVDRDYLHLRSEPQYQVALTIDYFIRHIEKLSNLSDQLYVEANLMQPGLLSKSFKDIAFLPQFEDFLKKGFRYFNKNGQYSFESLFFLRINFLVSRYLYLTDKTRGLPLLQSIQEQLLKQLAQPNDSDLVYVQQQYLFLTLMTQIDLSNLSDELFITATKTHFYLQNQANPNKHKALSHYIDVEIASAKFQLIATQLADKNPMLVQAAVKQALEKQFATRLLRIVPKAFPIYFLKTNQKKNLEFNVLLGKLFENNLMLTSLPLAIKNHSLIQHLSLDNKQDCLMTVDQSYMVLPDKINQVQLFYKKDRLTVQKKWQINNSINNYELHALTYKHQAYIASNRIPVNYSSLPAILKDKTMDYWQDTLSPECGLLVKNNKPLYYKADMLYELDAQGNQTLYYLENIESQWYSILNAFESNEFILCHRHPSKNTVIKLPRYNLNFIIDKNEVKLEETGEQIIERPSFIHPAVAGLTLEIDNYLRFLMPVARFYPTIKGLKTGDFYSPSHDTTGRIATIILTDTLKNQIPLPDYQGSEKHLAFRIENGELVADSVEDALYLAYTYLSTHQPEKAWKILEDCNTSLGGLTGNPAELKYIAWIYEPLPEIIPHAKDAYIETPPYIACRLKALSLLSDYLLQGKNFDLPLPKINDTANYHYALIEHKNLKSFLTNLPFNIYKTFSSLQRMRRHLEHHFTLSMLERKRLLDYYHKGENSNKPSGALGYEWMCISLESLLSEREALLARIKTGVPTEADSKRLNLIEKRLSQMEPILAQSTILEKKSIDLSLSLNIKIKTGHLSEQTKNVWKQQSENLLNKKFDSLALNQALDSLSSGINDDDFMCRFDALFAVVFLSDDQNQIKRLSDFCTKTLIANRHVPLDKQDSNIPLLSNILYRVLHNRPILLKNDWKHVSFTRLQGCTYALNVPEIQIYQAKDVYQDILATPEDILKKERLKPVSLVTKKLKITGLLEQTTIKNYLKNQIAQPLNELILSYRSFCKKGTVQINTATTEALAGKELLALEQGQKSFGQTLLNDPILINLMEELFKTVEQPILDQANKSWALALELARQGPDDPNKKQAWNLDTQSRAKATLNQTELLSIFCRADASYTLEKSGLNPEKAQILHDLIQQALFEEIQAQLISNMRADFELALAESDPYLSKQVLDFLAKEELPGLDDPVTILLQKAEEILLRPRQVAALDSLLKPQSEGRGVEGKIEKIIPGGGKTKVIIPIYAEKLAQGDNLVVIEVPTASLATNHADLNRSSQKLFGKRAYRFEFDRDSNSSSTRLKEIYLLFIEIMTARCYLVTTGDSMPALELKYGELVLKDPKDRDEDWKKQVYWLDKITNLLHHYADAMIDEGHQVLWFKKKLIYTIGEPTPISQDYIQYALAFYSYIDSDFIRKGPNLSNDYDWSAFKENLAMQIISDSLGLLNPFVKQAQIRYGDKVQLELRDYILGLSETVPEAVLRASAEEKASLAFFKQELSSVIKDTLCRKLNVSYGSSQLEYLSPTESTLAIPYLGNMVANEQSRFGNDFVAINNTIQMFLINGISKDLLADQVKAWQAAARQELGQNPNLKHFNETPTARGFALLEANSWTLAEFDVNDDSQLSALHQKYKDNRALQFTLLKDRVLAQIQQESGFMQSDAFNHVDIYRSCQTISGTPNKGMACHQKLTFNYKSSLGTDAYVIELLSHKKTAVSFFDYENIEPFLKAIFTNSKAGARTRAIIDINATFTGLVNIKVARAIAIFAQNNPGFFSKTLKYVFYFNDDQILSALDIHNPELSILLGTSDEKEISRRLRCKPEERFTYYDQVHTLGIDIKQYKYANAIVLLDENVSFQYFAQGNLRMRGIGEEQTTELILPTRVRGLNYDALVKRLEHNELKELPLDNLFSAKAQMNNLLRRMSLDMIQDLDSEKAEEKAFLGQQFNCFLKETPLTDLYTLYGAVTKTQKITDIFATFKMQLLDIWKDCHKNAELKLSSENLKNLDNKLQDLIDLATPHCLEEYREFINSTGKEVQIQKQIQKQIERIELKELFNSGLFEAFQLKWSNQSLEGEDKSMTLAINEFCGAKTLFSTRLKVSKNYAQVYQGQKQHLTAFMKPVFLVWYRIKNNELEATIVTPQETNDLANHFFLKTNNWISTTEDTIVAGLAPNNINQQKEYQSFREQIRFFNGDFLSLLNQNSPLIWIQENTEEKINFFESKMKIYRPDPEAGFHQFKTVLTQANTKGYNYIVNHAFMDLRQIDWKSIVPKTLPVQVAEYNKTAEAFYYINENWLETNLVLRELEQQFGLSMRSLGYIDDHLNYLIGLKNFLKETNFLRPPFLQKLKTNDPRFETFFGMSVDNFYKRQSLNLLGINLTDPKWLQASHEAIKILRTLPALKTKKNIFDLAINELAIAAKTPELLIKLFKEELHSKTLIDSILQNKYCHERFIHQLLDLKPEINTLKLIAQNCSTEQIESLLQHDNCSHDFICCLVDANKLKLVRALEIFEPYSTIVLSEEMELWLVSKCNTQELIDLYLSKFNHFEAAVLLLLEKDNLDENQLTTIIQKTENSQILAKIHNHQATPYSLKQEIYQHPQLNLSLLENLKIEVDNDWLTILNHPTAADSTILAHIAKITSNKDVLAALFKHPKFNEDIFQIAIQSKKPLSWLAELCNDNNYFQILLNQPVLEPEVLQIILAKKLDYDNLHQALRFGNLTEDDRENWLENMRRWQASRKLELLNNGRNNHLKLTASLDSLRLKACEHALKAMSNNDYIPVAEAAITLYQKLHHEVELYLDRKSTQEQFQQSSHEAIKEALPILGAHRGYKQILVDIINVIMNIFTFKFAWSDNWRFFEPRTATIETLDEYEGSKTAYLSQGMNND